MQLSLVTGYWIRILLMFSTHQPSFLPCQNFFGKHRWDSHILWKMNCKEITCLVIFLRWWVQICSTTYVVRNRDAFPLYFSWWHLIDRSNVSELSKFNFRLNYNFFFYASLESGSKMKIIFSLANLSYVCFRIWIEGMGQNHRK